MALSPTQVTGNHTASYEAYYKDVDPNGHGTIGAIEAARFLKKSGLSDVVLSRIWDLSDPGGRGCLDKTGMFVALKLVSLAQAGRDINMSNITIDMPPPKMAGLSITLPKKPPPPTSAPFIPNFPPSVAAVDWTIKSMEREKYNKTFESLQPVNGVIPGNKVKGVLMESKLPIETLGQIWELADQDKDGSLNRGEFICAMHLVYKALEKHEIPSVLPPELIAVSSLYRSSNTTASITMDRPARPKISPAAALPAMAMAPPPLMSEPVNTSTNGSLATNRTLSSYASLTSGVGDSAAAIIAPSGHADNIAPSLDWVVSADERVKSDMLFIKSDIDRDGFVSGMEIKDVFLQSGVPQSILAHIWTLCDISQVGKLNSEQFALAMWLVAKCLKGQDPPAALRPDMVPPSFRMAAAADKPRSLENNNSSYSNPELEMISRDIEELSREKLSLDMDISQKEASIRVKTGEIKNLQIESDTLAATLKQLDNQKGEAQKRLDDLKNQVEKLGIQASEQADIIAVEESELFNKKQQLESLKQEERRLELMKQNKDETLNGLGSKLQVTQLHISQAKALISQLEEQRKQISNALTSCDAAITSGNSATVPDAILALNPDYRDTQYSQLRTVTVEIKDNGFYGTEGNSFNGTTTNSEFFIDQFSNDNINRNSVAFGSTDHSKSAFSNTNGQFAKDPFDKPNSNTAMNTDPFDAFGGRSDNINTSEPDKDAFGCDPFAVLHAPTKDDAMRATSPSPALPPKKAKPPRPAPPRPQPPSFNTSGGGSMNDQFSNSTFANFANFEDKFSSTTRAETSSHPIASDSVPKLEFTDDPFRDYRYEDPFNIAFEEEAKFESDKRATTMSSGTSFPSLSINSDSLLSTSTAPTGRLSAPLQNAVKNFNSKELITQNGRSSVPFNIQNECSKIG